VETGRADEINAALEDRKVPQEREDTDDDDNDSDDLFGSAVDRQQVDEIQHQNDDDESDKRADKEVHENPRFKCGK
jgi:hypothetical protein